MCADSLYGPTEGGAFSLYGLLKAVRTLGMLCVGLSPLPQGRSHFGVWSLLGLLGDTAGEEPLWRESAEVSGLDVVGRQVNAWTEAPC